MHRDRPPVCRQDTPLHSAGWRKLQSTAAFKLLAGISYLQQQQQQQQPKMKRLHLLLRSACRRTLTLERESCVCDCPGPVGKGGSLSTNTCVLMMGTCTGAASCCQTCMMTSTCSVVCTHAHEAVAPMKVSAKKEMLQARVQHESSLKTISPYVPPCEPLST